MSDHATLSPSKAARWLACPASVREEAKYPDTSGPAAVDGSKTHMVLENALQLYNIVGSMPDPMDFLNTEYRYSGETFKLDADRASRVKVATDYISKRITEIGGKVRVLPERKVSPAPVVGRADMDGTCDVQLWGENFLEVIDYKDGMGVVEAKDNPQLELYALGACYLQTGTVRMTIVQPKLALLGMEPITWTEVSVEELRAKAEKFIDGAARTDDPNAPHVAGEHCKFCKHKGACTEHSGNVMKEVGVMFQAVQSPVEVAQQSADREPGSMSNDELRQLVEAGPALRQLIEAAEAEALRRLQSGQSIGGLKVVHGRGSRAWSLDDEDMADKLTKMGVPKSAVWETKLVSPAKVEKLVWEKKSRTGEVERKQLSERQLKTLQTEYIKKSQGKLTVVPESDHREAVVFDASPMFSPVDDDLPDWLKAK